MKSLIGTLKTWKERIEQRKQLITLDDRVLRDIGITRSDVLTEASKKMWEK